ncbi:hypothetical protein [Streptomyces caeruleatus]|uniref:Uncharacterized protein n=1 Tax=Streptomyces caeruleatus TaxID=661399 RepID=A0A124I7F3_9ACTN|nr:hypothetical protein [Streptomyces caeruleatus]KUN96074.1 hypothetical protein AQJ67_32985 [Streptomyces caeruleatus]
MTTHGGNAANRSGGLSGSGGHPLSSGASTDELRAGFQDQGRSELVEEGRREARQARGMYAGFAGLVAVTCLVLIVVRLGQGDALGVWVATYAVGVALGGWGFVLARIGHTRWAMMVTCIGVALAGVGDSPVFR